MAAELLLAVAALLALLAMAVLASRPQDRLNQLLSSVLLLLAGSTLAFFAFRQGRDPAFFRLVEWYEVPATFLLLLLTDRLFLPQPRTPRRRAALALAGAVTVALLAGLALAPDTFAPSAEDVARSGSSPLRQAPQLYLTVVEVAAIVLAARATRSPERSALQRRQAALVALAFALLVAHAGTTSAFTLANGALVQPNTSGSEALDVARIVGLVAVLRAAPWMARVFEGRARQAVLAGVGAAVALGVLEGLVFELRIVLPGFEGARPLVLGASALVLAVAVLRYGLGGVVVGAPRRLGRLALEPRQPDVAAERARLYLAALAAARGPGGELGRDAERMLARLRGELGLTERDHAMLAGLARADGAPRVLFGRYHVERELARGGTGVAYLATDAAIGRKVVVKQLAAPGRKPEQLLAEIRALGLLNHPKVLTLYHTEQVGDQVFLVLEHAAGGSLAQRVARGPVPAAEAVRYACDLLEALDAVHRARLVHGDVKLGNALLAADGTAKLADFGSARVRRSHGDRDATVLLADSSATLSSAAPEQVRGEPLTPATDLYGVGVLLYRLLTAEHYIAFEGLGDYEAGQRVLHAPPRLPHPRIPARLVPILAHALAKDPAQRFESAAEMRAVLLAVSPVSKTRRVARTAAAQPG